MTDPYKVLGVSPSATDEEVSDVVSDFYVERFQNVQGLLPGTHVKEKTFLLFSLLFILLLPH